MPFRETVKLLAVTSDSDHEPSSSYDTYTCAAALLASPNTRRHVYHRTWTIRQRTLLYGTTASNLDRLHWHGTRWISRSSVPQSCVSSFDQYYWLPVRQRITYKTQIHWHSDSYRCHMSHATDYLPARSLRSSGPSVKGQSQESWSFEHIEPAFLTKLFSIATVNTPYLYFSTHNRLRTRKPLVVSPSNPRRQSVSCRVRSSVEKSSTHVTAAPSLSTFRSRFKSHLFSFSYPNFWLFSLFFTC